MKLQKGVPIRLLARLSDHEVPEELDITPLHQAAFAGDFASVQKLLNAGANVNAIDTYGWTSLHDAVIQGHIEIVKLLIAAGVDVNAQDNEDRYTPLHEAARMQFPEITKLLIAASADIKLKDKWGDTAADIEQKMARDNEKHTFN